MSKFLCCSLPVANLRAMCKTSSKQQQTQRKVQSLIPPFPCLSTTSGTTTKQDVIRSQKDKQKMKRVDQIMLDYEAAGCPVSPGEERIIAALEKKRSSSSNSHNVGSPDDMPLEGLPTTEAGIEQLRNSVTEPADGEINIQWKKMGIQSQARKIPSRMTSEGGEQWMCCLATKPQTR